MGVQAPAPDPMQRIAPVRMGRCKSLILHSLALASPMHLHGSTNDDRQPGDTTMKTKTQIKAGKKVGTVPVITNAIYR